MPRFENMHKGLPYYPPNGKEASSTEKGAMKWPRSKDIISTCCNLQNNQTLNRICTVVERRSLTLSQIVENVVQDSSKSSSMQEVGFPIRNTLC